MGYKRTKHYFDMLYKEDLVRERGICYTEAWGIQASAIDPEVDCIPVGDLTLRGSMGTHPVAVHHLILHGKLGAYVPFPGESDHCLFKFFLETHDQNYFDMLHKDTLYTPA